jgi:hypothetical protein
MDASAGSGGKGGMGGMGGSAGAAGMMAGDAGETYQCKPPEPEKGGTASEGQACCSGQGVCTKNPTGPGSQAYGLSDCAAGKDLKCAPAVIADPDAGVGDDGGAGALPASCRMQLGTATDAPDFEGRCIPSCFVSADPSTANLSRSTCDMGSVCVPCYSPLTGDSTGACAQPGDAPVDPAPTAFASCGDQDSGYCVPAGLVSGAAAGAMLPQLTCGDGAVCAPKSRVADSKACFAHCDSGIGGPGACIAKFIIPMQFQAALQQSTCMPGEICAPCVSPLDMMRTGACD